MSSHPLIPLQRTPFTVVRLRLALSDGSTFDRPYPLTEGGHEFACFATYIDGSEWPFEAYWTCPMLLTIGGIDSWSVFGTQRRQSVTVHASAQHERYPELACWAFKPGSALGDTPHDSTAFEYSAFE
jgi:hypothetical protein